MLSAQSIVAPDAASDGDEPSGPSSLADAALSLWQLGGPAPLRALAERIVTVHAAAALAHPIAYGALLRVATRLAVPPRQLVVVAADRAAPLVRIARTVPCDVLAIVDEAQAAAWARAGFELFAGKTAVDGSATAYDCHDFACRLPVTDAAALVV